MKKPLPESIEIVMPFQVEWREGFAAAKSCSVAPHECPYSDRQGRAWGNGYRAGLQDAANEAREQEKKR